jgi:hypothetical protein
MYTNPIFGHDIRWISLSLVHISVANIVSATRLWPAFWGWSPFGTCGGGSKGRVFPHGGHGGHGGHGSSARQCTLLLPAGALKPPLDGPSQILPAMIGTLQDMMEKRWKKWVIDDDFLIFFGCLSNLSSWHCLFSGWLGLGFDTWWLMLGYPADHRRSNGAAQTKRFPAGRIIAQKMGGLPSHANHVWPDGTLQ